MSGVPLCVIVSVGKLHALIQQCCKTTHWQHSTRSLAGHHDMHSSMFVYHIDMHQACSQLNGICGTPLSIVTLLGQICRPTESGHRSAACLVVLGHVPIPHN